MRALLSSNPPPPLFACLPSQEVLDHIAPMIEPESPLSQRETARADALTGPGQRSDFVAARILTRLLVGRWHRPGADLTAIAEIVLEQTCDTCGGPHGRPAEVCGLAVSWAHSAGFVAAAVGSGPVGVDVEPLVAARVDMSRGAKELRAWVRGEALVKRGHGTLDESLTWQPLLDGPPAPRGQRYVVDGEGRPHRRRRPFPRGPGLVITDAPAANAGAVCSVAAGCAARWVNPLL